MDFARSVKAIALPQGVPSTFDRHLIELENQVQRLMEAHLALTQHNQVNKVTTSCEIYSGPHDTQYCMEDPNKPLLNMYLHVPMKQEVSGTLSSPRKTILVTPVIHHGEVTQTLGLVSNSMASQDARLSKFKADFKQQQSEMTNKIDIVLKAITDRIVGVLPSDTVKNLKLSTSLVLSAHSYPNMDSQRSNHIQGSINTITIHSEKQSDSYEEKAKENKEEEKESPKNIYVNPFTPSNPSVAFITKKVLKFNSFFESLRLVPQSFDTEVVCTKGDDEEVMFIELIRKNDDSSEGEPEEE
uniref:MAK10-like protein n=1 Tax=Tanacetum cinerariifolium TaxID=118510 RepID=A0A6L2LBN8_TANCI|nr:MAK10-like protein [Tanacetum cinerariifolium]